MPLTTADDDGRPWATPVWFAALGRAQEQDIGSWSEGDVSGAARFRIYRARASRVYVLDDHDGRVEVGG